MKIKAGTSCYISCPGKDGTIRPITDGTGRSFFTADQEVEVENISCDNKNLIAVLTCANIIEDLVAGDDIQTIVWINKKNI